MKTENVIAAPQPAAPVADPWTTRRARLAVPLVPVAAALALGLTGISGASFWIDEAATISIAQRPLGDMFRVFQEMDAVHGLYYLIMHVVIGLFGIGETAMRLPTVLVTAAAAGGVAVLGRRHANPRTGLLAGLFYAGGVTVMQYAQEARSYAFAAATAVLASYLFVRGTETRAVRWFAGYSVTIMLLGLLHLYALLLVPAHGITLYWRRQALRPVLGRWLLAVAVAVAALIPYLLVVTGQRVQVDWIPPEDASRLYSLVDFMAGNDRLVLPIGAIAGAGALATVLARRGLDLPALAVPWALAPVTILLLAGFVEPLLEARYVVFSLPAVALLAGAGLDWLGRQKAPLMAAALVPIVMISLPSQVRIREQDSKLDDLRAAAQFVRERARPGDAVLYLDSALRWDTAAYPDAYTGLRDITLAASPQRTYTLTGTDVHVPALLRARLLQGNRVFVMKRHLAESSPEEIAMRRAAVDATGPYREVAVLEYKGGRVRLLERLPRQRPPAARRPVRPPVAPAP
ncbi:hypothetical protein DPM19_14805 [Actinomadura craniellae]|uniref:Glycosyltransferase RgtA/B/C/D-like domain-containing protein n=1 Tax=Actinomadura craniellae TaxID=2231787 RepID=A0A365H5G9_9ACTN|nr:glycosyltransferase family 39 protein [Actinomadura craniellae]RAY14246.1 hypothetical protein DPM19_14805 [Actinomadura craniellae]